MHYWAINAQTYCAAGIMKSGMKLTKAEVGGWGSTSVTAILCRKRYKTPDEASLRLPAFRQRPLHDHSAQVFAEHSNAYTCGLIKPKYNILINFLLQW
jgi:hypothetical protein